MASSCVPFAFTPVEIDRTFFSNENDMKRANPKLVDGGVYDNQGIQKLTQKGSSYECDVIITSDAGNKIPFIGSYNNTIILLIRTMDVFMARIKNFQIAQNLYNNTSTVNKEIAYLSLGWDIENCISGFIQNLQAGNIIKSVIEAHKIPDEWVENVPKYKGQIMELLELSVNYKKIESEKLNNVDIEIARKVGTNLTTLSKQQIDFLSKHAANITELQIKLYCPNILN